MGLIGNGRLLQKVRNRNFGGLVLCCERENFNKSDRNRFFGEGLTDEKAGVPRGYRHPGAWVMPEKPGGLASSNETTITTTSDNCLMVGGRNAVGEATITLDLTGFAGLIASGSGTATITLSESALLASILSASGSANITFSENALLGALAGIFGSANITVSPTGGIMGIGYISGLSTNETEFSAAALAAAVWTALAASYNDAGTMGAKMNSAASAGDPWTTDLPGSYTGDQAGKILSDVKNKTKLIPGLF